MAAFPPAKAAVVLGSGLSAIAGRMAPGASLPYSEIDGMPISTVPGHEGRLYAHDGVVVLAGRVHLYEGLSVSTVVAPVRLAIEAGAEVIVLTNAAGSLTDRIAPGSVAVISDHLNLTGHNPLVGIDRGSGTPFIDLGDAYDPTLREIAATTAPGIEEGVYAGLLGPTYETHAEVRMLRTMGADLVGMSTVMETIAARYLGARVLGLSVVTNMAAGIGGSKPTHDDVKEMGARTADSLEHLLRGVLAEIA